MSKELETVRKFELTKAGRGLSVSSAAAVVSIVAGLFSFTPLLAIIPALFLIHNIGFGVVHRSQLVRPRVIEPAKSDDPWAPKYADINWGYIAELEHEGEFGHITSESFRACDRVTCRREIAELDAITNPPEENKPTISGGVFYQTGQIETGTVRGDRLQVGAIESRTYDGWTEFYQEEVALERARLLGYKRTSPGVMGRRNPDLPTEVQGYSRGVSYQTEALGILRNMGFTSRELREMEQRNPPTPEGLKPKKLYPETDVVLLGQLPPNSTVDNVYDHSRNVVNQIIHTTIDGEPTTLMRAAWDTTYEKMRRDKRRREKKAIAEQLKTKAAEEKAHAAKLESETKAMEERILQLSEHEETFAAALEAMVKYNSLLDEE